MRGLTLLVAGVVFFLVGSAAVALDPGGSFTDDDGSVHEGDIEAVAAEGITRGCNPPWNDRFCPHDQVTRGQMAAFLSRALGLPPGPDAFSDDDGHLFEGDINALAQAGITRGCNPPRNDRFCPDRFLTRGEMAAFLVRAYEYGRVDTDFFVDDDGSVFEAEINALAAARVARGCNPPTNTRFCPHAALTRQQMASFLARAEGLAAPTVPPRPELALRLIGNFRLPVYVTAPPGDDRLFVVEKEGRIRLWKDGAVTTFLDITDRVLAQGEMGLLSMAFHPDFPADGRVFVYYSTNPSGAGHDSQVSSFRLSSNPDRLDPTETKIITIPQPRSNHNGGHLVFDPNGYLVVALGDGGGANDPFRNAQNANTLPGSLLRIDVDSFVPYAIPSDNPFVGGPGRDEIWALGLRNPWRIWYDAGLLYVADVGQGRREEITVVPAHRPLVNYGWPRFEGSVCNPDDADPSCDRSGMEFPDVEYRHDGSVCGVIGGIVYRGEKLPWLRGHYFYGDLCAGFIRSFRTADGSRIDDPEDWTARLGSRRGLWSFGTDGRGELVVVIGNGPVYRLEPK